MVSNCTTSIHTSSIQLGLPHPIGMCGSDLGTTFLYRKGSPALGIRFHTPWHALWRTCWTPYQKLFSCDFGLSWRIIKEPWMMRQSTQIQQISKHRNLDRQETLKSFGYFFRTITWRGPTHLFSRTETSAVELCTEQKLRRRCRPSSWWLRCWKFCDDEKLDDFKSLVLGLDTNWMFRTPPQRHMPGEWIDFQWLHDWNCSPCRSFHTFTRWFQTCFLSFS